MHAHSGKKTSSAAERKAQALLGALGWLWEPLGRLVPKRLRMRRMNSSFFTLIEAGMANRTKKNAVRAP